MATQTLFIGLDAADRDLILSWAQAGKLPNLRALLLRAAWGPTTNPVGLFVGAVWPSFYTGVSPAKHGRYCDEQLQPGSYRHRRFSPAQITREPFWSTVGRAGRRVAVIDVPRTAPTHGLNGVHIVDWGSHDPDYGFTTCPEHLAARLEGPFEAQPHRCDDMARGSCTPAQLRDHLIERIEAKERLSAHLLEREPWDLFMTVFSESHCAGHQFWHLHDPAHPRHDLALAQSLGDPLLDVYMALDAALGRLVERAGPEAQVFVLASHGMGPRYDATFLLGEMLRRLEAASLSAPRRGAGHLLARAWRGTPEPLRAALRPLTRSLGVPLGRLLPTLDSEGSQKAFPVPNNDAYGAIRINQAGREPHGRLRPGAETDAFVAQLTRDLLAFTILPSGRRLVRRVLRSAEHFQGELLHTLPDLLVEWNREAPIRRIHSPCTGTIEGRYQGARSGDHKPGGMVLATAPHLTPGLLGHPVRIIDLAPTLAASVGVALPEVDGRVVTGLLPSIAEAL